ADVSAKGAQARAEPDRGPLRAGSGLLARGRAGAGAADVGGRLQGEHVQSLGQEVSGHALAGAPGPGAAAHLALVVLLAQGLTPTALTVGRVTAVAWPPQQALAWRSPKRPIARRRSPASARSRTGRSA